ncbi:unnamed protein product [Rhizophagus irregularis]|uniref:Galactose oxidase n=1 Tax=Rhizophagus irregularis TaxID=588596 RepID=A0A2N1NVB9_9GLOM|nr:galactose oxidase [Rhizophagus irregularis]CAB4385365.1 unnamed protein product [Rhizophagus irregularis]CAB5350890.1 unnamed protein product [Rhizophagus irregularis]
MSYKSFYLFLIFALKYIFFGVESYIPVGRIGHSSILIGNKIYYFGGITDVGASLNDVFYLDLSQPFNVANPPWIKITDIPFGSSWGSVALDNSNNTEVYLFGGITDDVNTQKDSFKSFVYKFNINSLSWNIPAVSGIAPSRRIEMKAISDNSGKIYIFGGAANLLVGAQTRTFFSDMIIFDIADSSWSINTAVNGRATYSATLLSNGIIVYVGGFEPFNGNNDVVLIADISKILLFDTNSLTWSTKSARITASIPVENRQRHSAVLAPNDQIIVYGGTRTTDEVDFNQVYPDVLVLDTKKDPYEITAPDISTNTGIFPSLAGHTANLFGYYMIVAFGNTTHKDDEPSLGKNGIIYVMDIRNFTWINSLDQAADNKTLKTSSPVSQSNKNKLKLLLATAFGISGGLLALTGGFFVYRWINIKKREKDHAPGFFGSNDDDHDSIPGTPTDDNLSSY